MFTQDNIWTISKLRTKTQELFKKALKEPVFLFQRSVPKGVLLSFEKYQEMIEALEEYYLSLRAEGYEKEDKTKIKWESSEKVRKLLKL